MQDRLKAIQERLGKATPGPWKVVGKENWDIKKFPQIEMNTPDGKYFAVHNDNDADFIANCPTDIKYLLEALGQARSENKALTERCAITNQLLQQLAEDKFGGNWDGEIIFSSMATCKDGIRTGEFSSGAFIRYDLYQQSQAREQGLRDALTKIQTLSADAYSVMIEIDGLGEGNMECEYVKDIEDIARETLNQEGKV